jgi:FKBP-type peptidyl-prolyl cis-trans isomerase
MRLDAGTDSEDSLDSLDDDTGTVDYSDGEYTDEAPVSEIDSGGSDEGGQRRWIEGQRHSAPEEKERGEDAEDDEDDDSDSDSDDSGDDINADEMEDVEDQQREHKAAQEQNEMKVLLAQSERQAQMKRPAEAVVQPARKAKRPAMPVQQPIELSKTQRTKFNKLQQRMTTKRSGLRYVDLVPGKGAHPPPGRKTKCRYSMRLGSPYGPLIEQSGHKPYEFRLGLGEVIQGWDEGVETMRRGGKRALLVPPELGYGSRGVHPNIPGKATLYFELELL